MNNVSTQINNMNIKQRSDGRFEGRITVNNIRKSFYGKNKSEVKNKAKEYLLKVENGYKEPTKITLNAYIEYWLKTYKHNKIEESSYCRLVKVYKNQIKDTIGNYMIGKITSRDIQILIDNYANPVDNKTKPLAMSGLKKILHLLRPCFNMAIKEKIITENPCDNVYLPTESSIFIQTKEQFSLNDNEISELRTIALSKYKTSNEYISRDGFVLLLMLNLGLRVGEVLTLTWNDIDFSNQIVRINKTLQSNIIDFDSELNKQKIYSKVKNSTKTKNGVRVLKINDTVMGYLNDLRQYDTRHNIKSPYIACTYKGTRSTARNLQRSLDRLVNKTNINKHISLHTLRHTFGSTLIRNGVGIELVSKLMGHSNITITYNKYIHTLQEEEIKTMDMIKIC